MKKRLKKYGNSLVIGFTKEEVEIYGLIVGDVIVIEEMLRQPRKKKVKRWQK